MWTLEDYFVGHHDYASELTDATMDNAQITVDRWNNLLTAFGQEHPGEPPRIIVSGWRPLAVNAQVPGAAPKSHHMTGEALDGWDRNRALAKWLLSKAEEYLAQFELWYEDMRATPTWVHGQIVPPASGSRFFIPDVSWANRLAGHPLSISTLGG